MLVIFAKSFMTATGYRLVGMRDAAPLMENPRRKLKWLSRRGRA